MSVRRDHDRGGTLGGGAGDVALLRRPEPPPGRRDFGDLAPHGRSKALASYDGSVRVRDLATGTVLAELLAGQQFHEGGGTVNLSAAA